MSPRFAVALLTASLLTPIATLADRPGTTQDDVRYPGVAATFASGAQDVLDTGDVVYPGHHLTVTNTLRPRSMDALASADDVTYPSADEPSRAATPAERVARAETAAPDSRFACHCPHP